MKKYLIAALVTLSVVAITAFAASLQVTAGTLQAGSGTVGTCAADQDTKVTYGTPAYEDGVWKIASMTVASSTDCNDLDFSLTVTRADGTPLFAPQHGTFTGSPVLVNFAPFDTADADKVQILIRSAPTAP